MSAFHLICLMILLTTSFVLGVDFILGLLEKRQERAAFKRELQTMWQNRREDDDA